MFPLYLSFFLFSSLCFFDGDVGLGLELETGTGTGTVDRRKWVWPERPTISRFRPSTSVAKSFKMRLDFLRGGRVVVDLEIRDLERERRRWIWERREGLFVLKVDQAVSMAFRHSRTSNYVRVQATNLIAKSPARMDHSNNNKNSTNKYLMALTDEMLAQRNVESILFEGKKMMESTNLKKFELFAREVIMEEERRKTSILPTVALKQTSGSPTRTSSATTLSSLSSSC